MFAWSATSILVIFIINKNRVLFGFLSLMASGINDQDLVSEARRFDECGGCGEVVRMRQEKLVCLECHLYTCNLDHK